MYLSERLLSLSRPVVSVVVLALYIVNAGQNRFLLALYSVSAAFFVVSSAIIVGWIPAPRRWRTALLWLELGLATYLNGVASTDINGGPMPTLYIPIAVTIPLILDRRLWAPIAVSLAAGWLLSSLFGGWNPFEFWSYFGFIIYGSFLLFSGSVGLLVRNLRDEKERSEALLRQVKDSQAALERAHRQLQESAVRQQEMAVLEERQRLAREIHDGVAHCLTALVVQTQAGRRLLERSPEQAAVTIARCEELAREALQETRLAVRALHPSGLEQQTEVEALQRLGRDFGIATGVSVEVTADVAARSLPPDPVRLGHLYRIFQEALTNASRHGQAKHVNASLTVSDGRLNLSIHNDGRPPENLEPGVGLKSMLERVRSLGGTVTFEPDESGLLVHVSVPINGEAVS